MNKKKIKWEEMIVKFEEFKKNFIKNPLDESLTHFFKDFREMIENNEFSKEELLESRDRIQDLQNLFRENQDELNKKVTEAFDRKKNVSRYVKNSNLKK